MVGSEVYSTEVKKTEVLMENFRRAIGVLFECSAHFVHCRKTTPAFLVFIMCCCMLSEPSHLREGHVPMQHRFGCSHVWGAVGRLLPVPPDLLIAFLARSGLRMGVALLHWVHSPAGLRIKENKEVYEGEVTELTPEETENQVSWACGRSSRASSKGPGKCLAYKTQQ